MRTGVITLLYKNKGDIHELKHWRPISLLNIDYKILSHVLANRLKLTLSDLIMPNQSCGEKGRQISDHILSIKSILDYMESNHQSGALILFDQEKAFDKIETKFTFKTLQKNGFGPNFINWIKTLYKNIISKI
jgi:hypothetical protein